MTYLFVSMVIAGALLFMGALVMTACMASGAEKRQEDKSFRRAVRAAHLVMTAGGILFIVGFFALLIRSQP